MSYIIRPESCGPPQLLGGKAAALADLQRAGLSIPPWFVLAPEAFDISLRMADRQALQVSWDTMQRGAPQEQLLLGAKPRAELTEALATLCPKGERVAVRSSALDEDGAHHSFAGQLDSFLFVHPLEVAERVLAVWRSAFSERVLTYRREHRLGLTPQPPAVLIQQMVNATCSGVAFGADPVTGKRGVAVVAAVHGLGTSLVSGECDADTYHVDREGCILTRNIADKRIGHQYDPDSRSGVQSVELQEEDRKKPALNDDQVLAVAELARQAGRHFGCPQDIEWAIQDGRPYLLQSRPITSLSQMADPDGGLKLWDNSNIAESYSGVTTPLTFSFARRVYEEVYRQFCRIMWVTAATISAHDNTFRHMLGLIRGRVYYNLLSWYRALAMLPGFTVNRRFMEQMMGVKEELPEGILARLSRATWRDRLWDGFHMLVTLCGLLANHFRLPKKIQGFYQRLDNALAPTSQDLQDMRADELVAYYHDLERQLLTRWDAPLINDFFAMIFYGTLRRLTERWCGDREGTLQNDLLCGQGGMVSAEPAERVREMAQITADSAEFVACLCDGSLDVILRGIEQAPRFKSRYQEYLHRFGDRCLQELKLESPTLHDDPLPLLRSIGQLARSIQSSSATPLHRVEPDLRGRAEQLVKETLTGRPLRRAVLRWVLRHARARVCDRENLRFERTRIFGRVRRIFVELGRRFHSLGLLDAPRDIFYLEVDEILGFIEGTATTTDLKGLVVLRKTEFKGYHRSDVPADRFQTRGIVHHGNPFRELGVAVEPSDGDQRRGIGCCAGLVRGVVRVITDPRNAVLHTGEILVAERTDPGWIMLFPAAAALLVERGSLLSHSAIVSREMGIPTIVSIPGVTQWLKDGDQVELDGRSGVVRRINVSDEAMSDAKRSC